MGLLTAEQLRLIMPLLAPARATTLLPFLNLALEEFQIDETLPRTAAFVANLAEESGELRYFEELDSGAAYDTGKKALALGNTPEADGDGQFYKGHGPIQITGKRNHVRCGAALGLNLLENPRLLTRPEYGFRAAAWFWADNKLNHISDMLHGTWDYEEEKVFKAICRTINGGTNGLPRRIKYYRRALFVLNESAAVIPTKPDANTSATPLTPGAPATPTSQDTKAVDSAIDASPSPTKVQQVFQSVWARTGGHVLRFGGWLYTAVKAGDRATILGLAVFTAGLVFMCYWYRKDLKLLFHTARQWVKGYFYD